MDVSFEKDSFENVAILPGIDWELPLPCGSSLYDLETPQSDSVMAKIVLPKAGLSSATLLRGYGRKRMVCEAE